MHTPDALVAVHARPHAPQCDDDARRSVSQPFAGSPSQSPKPSLQAHAQAPDAQLAVALARVAQAIPQPPQCDAEVCVSVSQPFEASPSQSPKGAVQLATAQAPARHAATPFVAVHARPQAPQFAVEVCASTHAPAQQVEPVGHGCASVQPITQRPAAHTVPAAQWAFVVHSTQVWAATSQRRLGAVHPSSARHPATQALSGPQCCAAGHMSLAAVHVGAASAGDASAGDVSADDASAGGASVGDVSSVASWASDVAASTGGVAFDPPPQPRATAQRTKQVVRGRDVIVR